MHHFKSHLGKSKVLIHFAERLIFSVLIIFKKSEIRDRLKPLLEVLCKESYVLKRKFIDLNWVRARVSLVSSDNVNMRPTCMYLYIGSSSMNPQAEH